MAQSDVVGPFLFFVFVLFCFGLHCSWRISRLLIGLHSLSHMSRFEWNVWIRTASLFGLAAKPPSPSPAHIMLILLSVSFDSISL
jgi:hypothetical protein